MSDLLVPVVVLLSSLGVLGVRRSTDDLTIRSIKISFRQFFEIIGRFVLFFCINIALIFLFVLSMRALGRFVSLYILSNPMLMLFSLAQAVFFSLQKYSVEVPRKGDPYP
jgi:hypothetical protein